MARGQWALVLFEGSQVLITIHTPKGSTCADGISIQVNALSVFALNCLRLRCSHLAVVVVNGRLISFWMPWWLSMGPEGVWPGASVINIQYVSPTPETPSDYRLINSVWLDCSPTFEWLQIHTYTRNVRLYLVARERNRSDHNNPIRTRVELKPTQLDPNIIIEITHIFTQIICQLVGGKLNFKRPTR